MPVSVPFLGSAPRNCSVQSLFESNTFEAAHSAPSIAPGTPQGLLDGHALALVRASLLRRSNPACEFGE